MVCVYPLHSSDRTAVSHATRWYSLLVPSGGSPSPLNTRSAQRLLTPRTLVHQRPRWPWTVPLTHPHCYSLLLRLPGRLSAPRAVFFSLILYLFAESGRAPMRSHMHHRFAPSCTMIQVPTDELNYGRDFLYNNKQHSVQRLHPRSPNNTFMSRLQRVQSSRGGTTTRSSSRTIIVRGYSSNDACRTVFFTVGTSLCINNDYKHT